VRALTSAADFIGGPRSWRQKDVAGLPARPSTSEDDERVRRLGRSQLSGPSVEAACASYTYRSMGGQPCSELGPNERVSRQPAPSLAGSARDDPRAGKSSVPRPSTEMCRFPALCRAGVEPGTRLRDQRGNDREAGGRVRQIRQQKRPICRDFYGSDGTRTRDLRRDRPVMISPGWAEIGGDYRRDQVFRLWACGDRRAPAGASGGLLRDERGMLRCLSRKRTGSARDAVVVLGAAAGS
jgi:hypothetical protein